MKNTRQRHFPPALLLVARWAVHFRNLPLLVDKNKNKLVCKYISFRLFCCLAIISFLPLLHNYLYPFAFLPFLSISFDTSGDLPSFFLYHSQFERCLLPSKYLVIEK